MPLARIITSSQACSRQLAIDLLARGYTVEIVSPDKIPDNLADLELRVDAGPGDQLLATVEAHDGDRTTSLEFIHHLKAPMGDFIRRPPDAREALRFMGEPRSFTAVRVKEVELPEAASASQHGISVATEVLNDPEVQVHPEVHSSVALSEEEPLIAPLSRSSEVAEQPIRFAADSPRIEKATAALPITELPATSPNLTPASVWPSWKIRFVLPSRWFWRAGVTFAGVMLLALAVGFGMRRTAKNSAQNSAAAPGNAIVASTDLNSLRGVVPATEVVKTNAPAAVPPAAKTRAKVSRQHDDDLVAPNTVVYLDRHLAEIAAGKTKSKKNSAGRRPHSHKQSGGIVAANTVTYLNSPAPKTPKPDTTVKTSSNLN
jgi:hypothetical protein